MSKKKYGLDVFSFNSNKSKFNNNFNKIFGNLFNTKLFNSKGQVTIFIIIGILLLLILIIVISFKSELITFNPEEIIPNDEGSVESFITGCIDKVGGEAIDLIGLQGGYIEIPDEIINDGSSSLKLSPMHVIPFWANGPDTNIPSLNSIKNKIDLYIENNLRECLFNQENFQKSYNLIEKSPITADTQIVESKVIFNVKWDIEIRDKAGEIVTEVFNHLAESPVKLKQAHSLAKKIVEGEMQSLKLEDITQDLIALEHPELPLSGVEISCQRKSWDVQKAENKLKELLRINLKQLKIKGTEFINFPPELSYYENHYIWNIDNDLQVPKMNVVFNYDNYPLTFQVTPTNGKKMYSNTMGGTNLLSFMCLQNWKFTYDVIYPVKITIQDETTGYKFNFAFTVHLIRNTPDRKSSLVARTTKKLDFVTDTDFCKNKVVPMIVVTNELVENNNGVYDLTPLENVNISYTCLKYRCEMGQTEYDFANNGNMAGSTLNYPYCVGGILRAEKDGYKEDWQRVTAKSGKETELNLVPLYKLPLKKIKIVTHNFVDTENIGPARELNSDGLAIVKIVYDKETIDRGDPNFYVGATAFHQEEKIIGKENLNDDTLNFLAKANFNYQLEINLLENDAIKGGYKVNWTVPWNELENAQEITFHVLSSDSNNQEDLFELILGLDNYSQLVPLPEIK